MNILWDRKIKDKERIHDMFCIYLFDWSDLFIHLDSTQEQGALDHYFLCKKGFVTIQLFIEFRVTKAHIHSFPSTCSDFAFLLVKPFIKDLYNVEFKSFIRVYHSSFQVMWDTWVFWPKKKRVEQKQVFKWKNGLQNSLFLLERMNSLILFLHSITLDRL